MPSRQRRWLRWLAISVAILGADAVMVSIGDVQGLDAGIWNGFATGVGPQGFRAIEAISLVGVVANPSGALTVVAVVVAAATTAVLVARGLPFTGATSLVAMVGAAALTQALKRIIDRGGPSLTPYTPIGHTFPSGTAAVAVAFLGFLAYVAFHVPRRPLSDVLAALCVAGAMALVISALTYHYPTEVIGGVATGFLWMCLLQILFWDSIRREIFGHRPNLDP